MFCDEDGEWIPSMDDSHNDDMIIFMEDGSTVINPVADPNVGLVQHAHAVQPVMMQYGHHEQHPIKREIYHDVVSSNAVAHTNLTGLQGVPNIDIQNDTNYGYETDETFDSIALSRTKRLKANEGLWHNAGHQNELVHQMTHVPVHIPEHIPVHISDRVPAHVAEPMMQQPQPTLQQSVNQAIYEQRDAFVDKFAGLIAKALEIGLKERLQVAGDIQVPIPDLIGLATAIVQACRAVYPQVKDCQDHIKEIYKNVKRPTNPELRAKILSGAISPEKLAVMTTNEMAPAAVRAKRAAAQEKFYREKVIIQPVGPVVRKNHKGIEVIDNQPKEIITLEEDPKDKKTSSEEVPPLTIYEPPIGCVGLWKPFEYAIHDTKKREKTDREKLKTIESVGGGWRKCNDLVENMMESRLSLIEDAVQDEDRRWRLTARLQNIYDLLRGQSENIKQVLIDAEKLCLG